jgi:glucose/arabinose dehydrogenase
MNRFLSVFYFILLPLLTLSQTRPLLKLDVFSSGYTDPLAIRNDRVNPWLYVVQRNGIIFIADTLGNKLPLPFLNITNRVLSGGERGLLGLAFDPDFSNNRRFYVNYTRSGDGATVIASLKVREDNPLRADSLSLKVLLTIAQPFSNHNGGDIHFAKDGYLYIGMGDGGSAGDPGNRSQDNNDLLGKMLRIKIETDSTYSIPPDNPFVGVPSAKPEIWATGLRNPWRFSFDRLSDDLWIGDVGQSAREEVNYVPSPKSAGLNFGWRCYEGELPYNTNGCEPFANYYAPAFTYDRTTTGGRSITGGYVYRGTQYPDLYGYYVCADYVSRNFWMLKPGDTLEVIPQLGLLASVVSFGEDINGELYLTSLNGNVYKVGSQCTDLVLDSLKITDATCEQAANGSIQAFISTENGPLTYQWSIPGTGETLSGLSPGKYTLRAQNQIGCWLTATAEVGFGNVEAPVIIRSGDSLLASGNGTFQWFLDGVQIDGADQNFIVPAENGSYTVVVTDKDGCLAQSEPFAFQSTAIASTLRDIIRIFPNPAKDYLAVSVLSGKVGMYRYQLMDLSGRIMLSGGLSDGVNRISLDNLASGMYLMTITDDRNNAPLTEKIAVNR